MADQILFLVYYWVYKSNRFCQPFCFSIIVRASWGRREITLLGSTRAIFQRKDGVDLNLGSAVRDFSWHKLQQDTVALCKLNALLHQIILIYLVLQYFLLCSCQDVNKIIITELN
jgi:hypothetical protein